jgi:hypothetical protein
VQQVLAATGAALAVPAEVPQMPIELSMEGATS